MLDLRTDEELMVAAGAGDDTAFGTLAWRLRDAITRFLRHMGCEDAAVDDLVQETIVRLWAARGRYEQTAALRTYVLTIAKNLWLKHQRRERAQPRGAEPSSLEGLSGLLGRHGGGFAPSSGASDSPELRLLAAYRARRLRTAIGGLPETQRLVFVLAHLEGLSYREIGQVLGIAEGTVKSRMHRAVRNLREALAVDYPALK